MANIAYLLISVDGEESISQRSVIGEYASEKNLRIDNYITVELPSARKERSRRVKDLFSGVDRWDVIIISDLAVMGDDISDIIAIAGGLLEKGVRFIAARQGMDLNSIGDDSSKTITGLFNMLISVGKEVTSRRIRGILAQKRKEGTVLGRPKGSISASKLDGRKELIVEYLSKGVSKASLARILETSPTNLASYLRTRKIVATGKDPAAKKTAPGKKTQEEKLAGEPLSSNAAAAQTTPAAAQTTPAVQFQETGEVLLCRQCGKNIHDPRTTTCAGGYVDYPNGESHPRVPYSKDQEDRCPKCGVIPGGFHHEACYMERCPRCGERLVSCGCKTPGIADEESTSAQSRSVRYLP